MEDPYPAGEPDLWLRQHGLKIGTGITSAVISALLTLQDMSAQPREAWYRAQLQRYDHACISIWPDDRLGIAALMLLFYRLDRQNPRS